MTEVNSSIYRQCFHLSINTHFGLAKLLLGADNCTYVNMG